MSYLPANPYTEDGSLNETLEISARPFSYVFTEVDTALVVIDMQHQFCSTGGLSDSVGLDITYTRAIIPSIQLLVNRYRELNWPIIHIRQGFLPDLSDIPPSLYWRAPKGSEPIVGKHGPLGRILIRGEKGHEIIPELVPHEGEFIIDKPGIGTFAHTKMENLLRERGINRLIVTGCTTEMCVHTFIREANDRGFSCLLVTDATASFEPDIHEAMIRVTVQQGGLFGWAATTEEVLEGLAKV